MEHRGATGIQSDIGHPGQHLLESDGELQTGEVGAEAPVYSGPEAEMPVGRAIQHAAVRIGELRRIPVGRGVVEHHGVAWAELLSAQFDVRRHGPGRLWIEPANRMNSSTARGTISGWAISRSRSAGWVAR